MTSPVPRRTPAIVKLEAYLEKKGDDGLKHAIQMRLAYAKMLAAYDDVLSTMEQEPMRPKTNGHEPTDEEWDVYLKHRAWNKDLSRCVRVLNSHVAVYERTVKDGTVFAIERGWRPGGDA